MCRFVALVALRLLRLFLVSCVSVLLSFGLLPAADAAAWPSPSISQSLTAATTLECKTAVSVSCFFVWVALQVDCRYLLGLFFCRSCFGAS